MTESEECQLDDLLDMLNDEDDAEEATVAVEDDPSEEAGEADEMASKLREMEEQVRLMKEKMVAKSKLQLIIEGPSWKSTISMTF